MLSAKRITVTRDDNGAINTQCSGGRGHRAQDFEQSGTPLSCRTHTGHVCAHTRTHTQAHIRHVCTRVCKHANTHTCAVCRHIHMDAQAQTHMHTRTQCTRAHTCRVRAQTCAHIKHTCSCTHVPYAHLHTCTHMPCAHTHTHVHTCCACTHSTHSTRTHTAVVFLSISRGSNEPVRNVKSYVITSDSSWQPRRALEGTRSPRPERESAQKHGAHLSSN